MSQNGQKDLVEALGLMYDAQGESAVYSAMEHAVTDGLRKAVQSKTPNLSKVTEATEKLQILDNYIANIHKIIDTYNQGNKDLFDYILKNDKTNQSGMVKQIFSSGDGNLNLLNINSSAATAFKTLCKQIEILEQASKNLHTDSLAESFTYNNQVYYYNSLIFPSKQLFIDILGGIGEGLGAAKAFEAIKDFLLSSKEKNVTITIKGTGTEKASEGFKGTKKADYEIIIDDKEKKIYLSFGISAKAQSLKRGKPVKTTFETTTLENLFIKYQIANTIEEYLFYNNLYHGRSGIVEMQYLRRKMAALAIANGAVTGSHQGENVLFIQYLDSLISVDKFFEELSMLASSENLSAMPSISIIGVGAVKKNNDFISGRGSKLRALLQEDDYQDLNPDDKNIVAWARSRQVLKTLRRLRTAVSYRH